MASIHSSISFIRMSSRENLEKSWDKIQEGAIVFVTDTRSIILKANGQPTEFCCQAPVSEYINAPARLMSDNFLLEIDPELKEKDITGWTLISQIDFISGAFRKFGLLGKSDVWLLEFKLFVEAQPGTIRIFSDKPISFFDGVLDDIIEEIKKLC